MNNQSFGSGNPFHAYTRGDFDLESGNSRKSFRKPKNSKFIAPIRMIHSISNRIHYFYKLHPVAVFLTSLSFGIAILVVLSLYERKLQMMDFRRSGDLGLSSDLYPLPNLRNLVMVAGHSIYTSTNCGKFDNEDSWFLEPYQKNPGQAATFLAHIQVGVESAAKDEGALLLFSGGETRKDGGPRSEAQSYWFVAESKGWFGHKDSVRDRALTEEHARDSFENLLFSVCRFRELTGSYPQNITIISYDFKRERFAQLHRPAIGFPEGSFFYVGTPTAPGAQEAAEKGEALARAQFQEDPYGCFGTLHRKRLTRDPFHRFVPYPDGCPELKGLFSYCGPVPFPGSLPWTK
ncbi:uncharacterized protein C57A10.07-like [Zingiber officinale]|uniref:DUF218 domain-containing protein n=1 Tax=Zingiber officinale TaxID=94328 RepID=A0A8J5GAU1_ZINOF|nr:uncharacterized protein C57A10.07-like [Zingiber officinale]XP_042394787.1 uncharacterized protein C57A10.07-like [Zingiber officinale]KAG6504630.1 hypothetical protein ZIOFF_036965 [Zingiber officinale]